MRRVLLFALLATFAFTLSVSAERYKYNFESGPPTATYPPSTPFPAVAFSFSWQSDHLIASPTCPVPGFDMSKLPGFSGPMLTGTGAAAYTFVDIVLDCTPTSYPPIAFHVDWNVATPGGLCGPQPNILAFTNYFNFFLTGPGSGLGSVSLLAPASGNFCTGFIDYNNNTLTITDTWAIGSPPGPVCLHCRKRISLRFVEGPVLPPRDGPVEATIQLATLSGERASSLRR